MDNLLMLAKRSAAPARKLSKGWRRGRDSNPWKPSGFNGFQDRRLKPLGHLSDDVQFIRKSRSADLRVLNSTISVLFSRDT
jgi:hypothetical protein